VSKQRIGAYVFGLLLVIFVTAILSGCGTRVVIEGCGGACTVHINDNKNYKSNQNPPEGGFGNDSPTNNNFVTKLSEAAPNIAKAFVSMQLQARGIPVNQAAAMTEGNCRDKMWKFWKTKCAPITTALQPSSDTNRTPITPKDALNALSEQLGIQ